VLASVVAYYAREQGVGPVVSPHNAYAFWREEAQGRDVVLSIGVEESALGHFFARSRRIGTYECEYCANWRTDMPIFVSFEPLRPLPVLLEEWRYYGSGAAPVLAPRR